MKLKISTLSILTVIFVLLWDVDAPDENKNRLDQNIAQCHATTQAFAQLGDDPTFVNIHLDPKPLEDFQPSGNMVQFEVADGDKARAYFIPSNLPSKDYLFVIHEWYGLNNYVKNESGKFAAQFPDMNILALDLYDGKVADNSDDARKYMQSVSTERALAIINGAQNFVGENANIYTVGWCFGGGWSLQASIELGNQAKGAVMFYGMPEKNLDRLKNLKCDVLGIFATEDAWISPAVAAEFKNNMGKLENKLILKSYEANHGFANPSNPKYNQEAATDAYKEMFAFISAHR